MFRELLTRLRLAALFAVLVMVALVTMHADRRPPEQDQDEMSWLSSLVLEITVPIQKMVATPADLARDAWQRYVALVDLREENEALRAQISNLREENLQYREALVESGRLRDIAEMRQDFEVPMLPLEIVGQDVSPWFRTILVDGGRSEGVHAGMPVITAEGVVGLVTATSARAGRAMLLLDRQSAIDGIVQRSRARGIVRGRGADLLEFEFVVRGADVQVGDVVISSGLGAVYPKGLRIGEVIEVDASGTGLTQKARIKPSVDFGRMEQVFVMLWRGPTMDLLYGDVEDPEAHSSTGPTTPSQP